MSSSQSIDQICTLLKTSLELAGAEGYVIGISGGVDSALAATLCCQAVGSDRVLGVFLPSGVTPSEDADDVAALADHLGIRFSTIPIGPLLDQYRNLPNFVETPYLLGNLMARTRMTILYYTANRDSYLVCGTSNRTEFLLGYCTKYGDNAADVQPLVHLLKTEVWDMARSLGVPQAIISRPPTAGLWQGQTDEGELGLTYTEIDNAIRSLDNGSDSLVSDTEKKVLAWMGGARHKQMPAPSLL
ncbi:MAG TPA: NAD+ synthase [Methanospirillum sp.]|nr:NAD+ synthase [Methanospirillum sp.]